MRCLLFVHRTVASTMDCHLNLSPLPPLNQVKYSISQPRGIFRMRDLRESIERTRRRASLGKAGKVMFLAAAGASLPPAQPGRWSNQTSAPISAFLLVNSIQTIASPPFFFPSFCNYSHRHETRLASAHTQYPVIDIVSQSQDRPSISKSSGRFT